MKNEEDEKVKDIRHAYLKTLVNDIFITTANSYEKRKDEKSSAIVTCVVRGEGTALKDCSFKATDFKRYVKLFEATFTDKKCLFDYKGKNSKQKDFSRDIAISKAMDFFKLNNISLDYVFHSQAEKYLFSRLLYRYIKQLLNALFDEYTLENIKKLNNLVREKYNKVLDKIRVEVNTVDIYELLYKNTHWSDAEITTYNGLNIKECDSIIMIENVFDYEKARLVDDIDRCIYMRPSDRRSTYTYSEISYKSYELYMMNRLGIQSSNQQQYIPVEIVELSDKKNNTIRFNKEKYIPRFVCIAFRKKDIEDELIADSKKDIENPIIINNLDDLEKELYNRLEAYVQTEYISKNYTAQRKQIMTPMEQSVRLIQELFQADYDKCFNEYDHIPDIFQAGFGKFGRFLKTHKIKINKDKIIYKYLISLWIDSFCARLLARTDPVNRSYSIGEDYSKLFKELNSLQLFKEMKSKKNNKPDSLENANTLFISFYQKHKATITEFNEKVDILKNKIFDSEFEYRLEKGESPYSLLRYTLCEFKTFLVEMKE